MAAAKKASGARTAGAKATRAKAPAMKATKPTATVRKPTPKVSAVRGKTVAWYLERLLPWQRALGEEIATLVKAVAPASTSSIKWAQPVWEVSGPMAWLRGAKAHLSFGFWRGAELDDPKGLLEGDGSRMRHLKLAEGASVPRRELERLVRQAAALNEAKGDPTKG